MRVFTKRAAVYLWGATAISFTLGLTGCSVLGFIAGAEIDYANQGGPQVDDLEDIGNFKMGQPVTVTRQNGDTLQGAYLGLFSRPSREYNRALDSAAALLGGAAFLPRVGKPVKVVTESDGVTSATTGTFDGFDPTCVYITVPASPERQSVPSGTIVSVIGTAHHFTTGETIRTWLSQGILPCVSSMRLVRADSVLNVPLDDIKVINNTVDSNVRYIGFAVGAVFDIGLIIMAKDFRMPSGSLSSSGSW